MNTKRTSLLIFMILACIVRGNAQDAIYSQFYANPIYLNPALAGSKLCQRITLNYRNQWPSIQQGYVSYSAAWDQNFDKLSGAFGVIVNTDVGGGGIYNKFSGSGIYSYRLQASRDIILNAGLQAGYMEYRLDWNKLVLGDQINVHTGSLEPTREGLPPKLNIGNVDFSAGLLAGYKESAYFGIAVNHLTRPDIAFYEGSTNRLPLRLTLHSGMLIDLSQIRHVEDYGNFSISPNIVYVQQGKFRQLNAGMYVNMFPLVGGLWLRHSFGNPDAVIVLLGYQQKNCKIEYSFDYTISRITIQSAGAHEISIAWLLHKNDSKRYHQLRSSNSEF
ncbi:MAG TPA: PorP/SprF family type IX secretion system membrane protein [Bacteroidales bacterium]|jgi:Bacteroidetes-specific putative membrane protein